MGYSYNKNGQLICEFCGCSFGVKKYPCPFGWCQPIASCKDCKKKYAVAFSVDKHRDCEKESKNFAEKQKQEQMILDKGKAVRCSALGITNSIVHVLFRKQDGSTIGRYMSQQTYRSIPILVSATPDMYAVLGPIKDAPCSFYKKQI